MSGIQERIEAARRAAQEQQARQEANRIQAARSFEDEDRLSLERRKQLGLEAARVTQVEQRLREASQQWGEGRVTTEVQDNGSVLTQLSSESTWYLADYEEIEKSSFGKYPTYSTSKTGEFSRAQGRVVYSSNYEGDKWGVKNISEEKFRGYITARHITATQISFSYDPDTNKMTIHTSDTHPPRMYEESPFPAGFFADPEIEQMAREMRPFPGIPQIVVPYEYVEVVGQDYVGAAIAQALDNRVNNFGLPRHYREVGSIKDLERKATEYNVDENIYRDAGYDVLRHFSGE